MQIKWLTSALKNLDQEAEYIAKDNPAAAQLIVRHIIDTINLLPDNPALGHPGRIHGTRELIIPKTRYIVPYRINVRMGQVEILRVFHSSRRLPEAW